QEIGGTIGVVVPVGHRREVDGWLGERDRERIPVLEALDTKGLEFDAIVVLEPDEIVDESDIGMRTLYVVLTRATRLLEMIGTSHRWRP
ncbi:MAG: helicase, partial [Actinomycetota bacterium]|nr:helicase [Actinomycetota bacterium]